MNIIQCCAPTNDSSGDDKNQFYDCLQSIVNKCPDWTKLTLIAIHLVNQFMQTSFIIYTSFDEIDLAKEIQLSCHGLLDNYR